MTSVEIESIGGQCPVEAEGTIDGHPFYFRARGISWDCIIARPGIDPVEAFTTEDEGKFPLTVTDYWGEPSDIHAAGWMTHVEAEEIIQRAADLWGSGKRGHHQLTQDPLRDALFKACSLYYLELHYGENIREAFAEDYTELASAVVALPPENRVAYERQFRYHKARIRVAFST